MNQLHTTLPFTSSLFFIYLLATVLFFYVVKTFLSTKIQYSWLIAATSIVYLVLLFPKPIQLLGVLIYYYLIYYILGRKLKYQKLLLPIILISLPMIFMKFLGIIPKIIYVNRFENLLSILLQIAGISYITFKVIQLYIDEKESQKTVSILNFFNFTTFVPTLLIGPIDRYHRFTTNVENGYNQMNYSNFTKGFDNFIKGLLFKFIIGEAINRLILSHLIDDGSIFYHLSYMYTYLFYLFFDFAGYCLLAISFGNFLGIDVPINFDKPFLSVNPKEFWKRWHKTLGEWLNDYFFKPIFKELTTKKSFKSSIQRQNVALFLTFTLMGFWNGITSYYIASGMLFGLYSVIHNYYYYLCQKNKRDVIFGSLNPKVVRIISIFIMFNASAFAIYIFSGKLI
jgi:membrane protein involved in D-alanine export